MFPILSLGFALLTATSVAQATTGRRFSSAEVGALTLPSSVDPSELDLEYDDGTTVEGRSVDLDGDRRADFLVRSSPLLCGASGNCPFAIVDGASGRTLGQLGGAVIIVSERRVNRHPVLQTWWNTGADSGEYSTYEFDGDVYRRVSRETVSGDRHRRLMEALRAMPALPPRD